MSYDLALWVGSRPASDADGMRTYEATFDALDEADDVEPPSTLIMELIDRLHRRWPPFDSASPWATAPLGAEDAQGDTLYINLVLDCSDVDVSVIADTARDLGVVCFDPQAEAVL